MKADTKYLCYVGEAADLTAPARFANGDWFLATDTKSLYKRIDGAWVASSPDFTIADAAITNAKLAHVATATIKGRVSANTGDVEDLSAANVLTILGALNAATLETHAAAYFATAEHAHAATDSGWVVQTITGANWNAGSYCKVRKINNVVYLKAYFLEGANTPGNPALTLEAAYRPLEDVWIKGLYSNEYTYYNITIGADGHVHVPGNDSATGQSAYVHESWLTD